MEKLTDLTRAYYFDREGKRVYVKRNPKKELEYATALTLNALKKGAGPRGIPRVPEK